MPSAIADYIDPAVLQELAERHYGRSPFAAPYAVTGGALRVLREAAERGECFRQLAIAAGEALGGSCWARARRTEAGRFQDDWRHESDETLILQLSGRSDHWFCAKTADRFDRESAPVYSGTLIAGDLLHLPSGWWRRSQAVDDCLSLELALPRRAP